MEGINLLKFHQKKHHIKKIVGISTTIVFLIFGALFLSFKFFYSSREVKNNEGFFATLSHLILSPDKPFASSRNVVNILILGIGGAGHEGPSLTDTMLIASLNKKDNQATMVSVPRDLLVDTKKFGKQKINALNAMAEAEDAGSGAEYAKDVVEDIVGAGIDHYVRIDFRAFQEIIDAVGGVDIDVPRAFTDPLFPRFDDEAQTFSVTFEKGYQHMDGRTALIYARSRHGNNNEGNDFARSRRQQQIILAMKDKILSSETYLSPSKMKDIFDALRGNIATDLGPFDIIGLAKLYKEMNLSEKNISTHVLTNGPQGPLYADYYNGQYVLLPKKKDWSDIRMILASSEEDTMPQIYTGDYAEPQKIMLAVLNGTEIAGLGSATAMTLEDFGYKIISLANAPERDFEKTTIYDMTGGAKKQAIDHIRGVLGANISSHHPDWINNFFETNLKPDFVIVVGTPKPSSL